MPYRIGQTARRLHGRGDRRPDRRAGAPAARPGPGAAGRGRLRPAPVCAARARSAAAAACSRALAATTLLAPLLLALAGKDFVIDRNLLPALVPLLLIAALGITARRAGRLGRRGRRRARRLLARLRGLDQLRPLAAAARLARGRREPRGADPPRAMVTWLLGAGVLRHYLSTGSFQVVPEGERWFIGEVDLISDGAAPPGARPASVRASAAPGRGPWGASRSPATRRPGLPGSRCASSTNAPIGFRNARVLMDGIGPTD